MKLFGSRPRRAAVALFALGGAVAGIGGAMVPAEATDNSCTAVGVWIYKNKQGRETKEQCLGPWHRNQRIGGGTESDNNNVPPGTPTGGGAYVWLPF